MLRQFQQFAFRFALVRWAAGLAFLLRGRLHLRAGRYYRAISDYCWVFRVANIAPLTRAAGRVIFEMVATTRRTGRNSLVDSYRADEASAACARLYAITGTGPHDIFRDLIVLKRATAHEKGVILLKYGRTFEAVVAMFDLARLMERYTFVLEPCWAGYCDPRILLMIAPGNPVLVQCFTEDDHRFITNVGFPLIPVRLGPADWVDADLFAPPAVESKLYDLVMVANWGAHKRHALLFGALKDISRRHSSGAMRVLLIGFPWSGRTANDIRREAASIGSDRVTIDVMESIPAAQVAHFVAQSKVFVFLSRKEGDNKALVEAMFVNVPAIVYNHTVGGAGSRINEATGIFSSEEDLADNIVYMLQHYKKFNPRAWATTHTGSAVATRVLDAALRAAVTGSGGTYIDSIAQKTNSPNLSYKDPASRVRFAGDYEFILSCRRFASTTHNEAVA
jgi:glycosyltransferase involved in cell wall biosynthesis